MKKVTFSFLVIFSLIIFASCGGKQETDKVEDAPTESTTTEVAALELSAGDDMKFDKSELTVKAGQKVTLTFHHTGTLAKAQMGHNFVLLKEGTDVNAFGQAAMASHDSDYIPEAFSGDIIVHTDLIGGGESTKIEFEAPTTPGNYTYICSFPGHFASMRGTFIVE